MNYKEILSQITTFIFDMDGVLTDGSVHVTNTGEMLRIMSIRDGYAIKTAVDLGYRVCIISGGSNPGVKERLQKLGVFDIYFSVPDKVEIFKEFTQENNINPKNILYMGDDLPDYHVMKLVGLPTCPQDATPEIKAIANYISHVSGGKGCVRDVIEQTLKIQNKWFQNFDGKHD